MVGLEAPRELQIPGHGPAGGSGAGREQRARSGARSRGRVSAPGAARTGALRAGRNRRLRPRRVARCPRRAEQAPSLCPCPSVPAHPAPSGRRHRPARPVTFAPRRDVTAARRPRHVAANGGTGRDPRGESEPARTHRGCSGPSPASPGLSRTFPGPTRNSPGPLHAPHRTHLCY